MIVSQPFEFLAYRGNDFQLQVTYSVSFKISPRHNSRSNFMQLMTDECVNNPGGQNKSRKPSIGIAFQPNTRSFRLRFRTEKIEVDEIVTGAQPVSNACGDVYTSPSMVHLCSPCNASHIVIIGQASDYCIHAMYTFI